MAWTHVIAGAYTALWLTMLVTGSAYLLRWFRRRGEMHGATGLLFVGIALSFLGHAEDQTLWTLANIDRSLGGTTQISLSKWYAEAIPLVVVHGKFMASFGAFFHLHVFFFHERTASPRKTIAAMSAAWFAVVVAVAGVLEVL